MSIDDGRLELGSRVDQQQEETNTLMDPSRAPCAVCKRLMPVTRTGLIRVHGPLDNRCDGSRVPPGSLPSDSDCGNSQILPPLVSDAPPSPQGALSPPKLAARTIKKIPRAARELAAKKLAGILGQVVASNDLASWDRLLHFGSRCLRVLPRGGSNYNTVKAFKKQIEDELDPAPPHPGRQQGRKAQKCSAVESLAARVTAKLEEGDFAGAIRLVCSEDTIADRSEATLNALRGKHPAPHPDTQICPAPLETSCTLSVSEEEVSQAVRSFPNGSAGGPDGLRPQHLRDLTGLSAGVGGPLLLRALTRFTNLILAGKTPETVRPLFFGANLVALEKKGGGVRPIAVGCTLRRLAAKAAAARVKSPMRSLLAPRQLGYGTPRGAEVAVHAARTYLDNLPLDHVLLKLDFSNAFNSVRRDKMLIQVSELAPELLPFVHSAYSAPSTLLWGETPLQSSEGVQQGDPLGPLLFCLAIHPLIEKLTSEFVVFYLDDGSLGGRVGEVLRDLQTVEGAAEELGLQLNRGKSEVIGHNSASLEPLLAAAPELKVTSPEQATLLGSAVGNVESVSRTIQEKTEMLGVMGNRLQYLHAHDAILLLRHALAIPKLLYTLRTSPCFASPELVAYDNMLRAITSSVTNTHFGEQDSSWTQASLPVKHGGLGIRSAVQLAPSAFLASAAASSNLVCQILPDRLAGTLDTAREEALAAWRQGSDVTPPSEPASHHQRNWDLPKVLETSASLLEAAPDIQSRARLLAAANKESGAWLNTLPVSSLGLRMDDDTVRVAVGLRLGIPLCRPHQCCLCGAEVDNLATHGLSCRRSEGRHPRHAALNEIIHRSLSSAHIPSRLEPSGVYRTDGKRPDGISMVPWRHGRVLVWDATCPDTFAPSHVSSAATSSGAVAKQAEQAKKAKYAHLDANHYFVPLVVETSGVLGPEALLFLRDLGHRLKEATGEPRSHQFLLQRLSVAVQRGNAAAVQGTLKGSMDSGWDGY